MKTAILRAPSPSLALCELTHIDREPIDPGIAASQHAAYREILAKCNYIVNTLPAEPTLPDSVFVEDTALVLPEAAIVLSLSADSRKAEAALIADALQPYRDLNFIEPPAKIEGGDVLRIGRKLFVGMTSRTDPAGAEALERLVREWGYAVVPVAVRGSLHLKTAVTATDDQTILMNTEWVEKAPFEDFHRIEVDGEEPFAANILRLGNTIVAHRGFERTNQKLRDAGFEVIEADISEFLKAEAGLTCLSLLVENDV